MQTHFLRAAVVVLGLIVLAMCIYLLPPAVLNDGISGYRWIFLGMEITAIPFFLALYQAIKLLDYIDTNRAFSDLSVKALNAIKYDAITISGLYVLGLPYIYQVANGDNAPGVLAIALVLAGAAATVAVFAALLQMLLKNAIEMKSENDLTV